MEATLNERMLSKINYGLIVVMAIIGILLILQSTLGHLTPIF